MAKDKGKQKAPDSGGISFPGLEKKMAPKAGVKKPEPKNIKTKSTDKRIRELCTIIFGNVGPKSKLHKPRTTFPFIVCDPEGIKHLSEDHRECYKLISDWFQPLQNLRHVDNIEWEEIFEHHRSHFLNETTKTFGGMRAKYTRFFHAIATLNEMEETAAATAAEGITVEEFTNRAVFVRLHSEADQCKAMAAELLAAEAQLRALAPRYGG